MSNFHTLQSICSFCSSFAPYSFLLVFISFLMLSSVPLLMLSVYYRQPRQLWPTISPRERKIGVRCWPGWSSHGRLQSPQCYSFCSCAKLWTPFPLHRERETSNSLYMPYSSSTLFSSRSPSHSWFSHLPPLTSAVQRLAQSSPRLFLLSSHSLCCRISRHSHPNQIHLFSAEHFPGSSLSEQLFLGYYLVSVQSHEHGIFCLRHWARTTILYSQRRRFVAPKWVYRVCGMICREKKTNLLVEIRLLNHRLISGEHLATLRSGWSL